MDFSAVCRTCLKSDHLNPIFPNPADWYRYSNAMHNATGLKVELNDGLPQNVCTFCIHFINKSLKFRKICRDVQAKLLESLEIQPKKNSEETPKKSKDFLVLSGKKIDNELKIEIKHENLCLNDSDNANEYTDYEVLIDDDEDEKLLEKEAETIENNVTIKVEAKSEFNLTDPNLYLLDDSSDNGNRVICKICQKNLSIRSITAHMDKAHPGADERKVKCELCDSYLMKNKISRHMSMIHYIKTGEESNIGRCGYCKSEFDKEELIKHVVSCSAKHKRRKVPESGRQMIECNICNKKMQRVSLRSHMATVHLSNRPVCEHCGGAFGNKFRLNEHYRAKHGYDKLKCSFCDYESASILAMQNHERRHRGEKPYVCETCGAKFHATYLLTQHKQSHRTEKPNKCDLCPASFKAKNSLYMHKKACHGTALFECTACSRSYSCRHYAMKHIRRAHRYNGPLPPLRELTDTQDVEDDET